MSFDPKIPPYHLSPASWDLGFSDIELLIGLHEGNDDTPEQDARREERDALFDALAHMTAPELRAYIDGIHSRLGEYFW